MLRHTWTALLCLLMVGSAALTYQIKYRAELAAEEVGSLRSEIGDMEEELSRLKAQWSLFNQPDRLQALVENHADVLPLQPLSPYQIATLGDLPEPSALARALPPRKPEPGQRVGPRLAVQENGIAVLIEGTNAQDRAALDNLITGGIGQ